MNDILFVIFSIGICLLLLNWIMLKTNVWFWLVRMIALDDARGGIINQATEIIAGAAALRLISLDQEIQIRKQVEECHVRNNQSTN